MVMKATLTRKQHIHAEAAKLFRDKGYNATSMRDIALAVGIEPSSLYSHISSKEQLLRKICFECGDTFLKGLQSILSEGGGPAETLRKLIRMHVAIAHHDVTVITVFNDEWRHLTEPELTEFVKMRKRYEDQCLGIIRQGMQEGSFRRIDSQVALSTVLSALHWIYRSKSFLHQNAGEVAREVSDLLLLGLQVDRTK